jgi:hypothetical protein
MKKFKSFALQKSFRVENKCKKNLFKLFFNKKSISVKKKNEVFLKEYSFGIKD